ncbi:MAG: type II and III secretion system family protein [Alphaproteobacteria bacterium]|nr:MAG: type II and III secretion system family protein [Alphaproteobacteria bacterium]
MYNLNNPSSVFVKLLRVSVVAFASFPLLSCSPVNVPGARNLSVPSPAMAAQRQDAVNEKPDSVIYLPLGSDVLVPKAPGSAGLPKEVVGPFELRSETVAGALQLILADYEIPMAFETDAGFERTVTVTNLRGPLDDIVRKVCSLADLYCAFEDGLLIVKETQTFTVTVPPIGGENDILSDIAKGLQAITGIAPITESATRTIIYEATNRTSELAERYFQRVRASTALIVFEVYIWEVSLNNGNSTGIDWEGIEAFGKFASGISIPGSVGANFNPISIGLPTTGGVTFGSDDVFQFISEYGAVKTISQPQITVLSGATASLRAADTVHYVSSLTRSVEDGETTVSTETDSVDTGFTLTIASHWDSATVYSKIDISLEEFKGFQNFDADGTVLQLPQTTERELSTQIRIRPGDSLLIAGLVRENDEFDTSGAGFDSPFFPTSRSVATSNTELVFLLKPRVIVYTDEER